MRQTEFASSCCRGKLSLQPIAAALSATGVFAAVVTAQLLRYVSGTVARATLLKSASRVRGGAANALAASRRNSGDLRTLYKHDDPEGHIFKPSGSVFWTRVAVRYSISLPLEGKVAERMRGRMRCQIHLVCMIIRFSGQSFSEGV